MFLVHFDALRLDHYDLSQELENLASEEDKRKTSIAARAEWLHPFLTQQLSCMVRNLIKKLVLL